MKDTHETRLLEYLRKYDSITSLQSIRDLGNTRLAATICTLRKKGHEIDSTSVEVTTRWNTTTTVAKYKLSEPVSRGWSLFKRG